MKEDRFGSQHLDIECSFLHHPALNEGVKGHEEFWAWKLTVEGQQYGAWHTALATEEDIDKCFAEAVKELLTKEFIKFKKQTQET